MKNSSTVHIHIFLETDTDIYQSLVLVNVGLQYKYYEDELDNTFIILYNWSLNNQTLYLIDENNHICICNIRNNYVLSLACEISQRFNILIIQSESFKGEGALSFSLWHKNN